MLCGTLQLSNNNKIYLNTCHIPVLVCVGVCVHACVHVCMCGVCMCVCVQAQFH